MIKSLGEPYWEIRIVSGPRFTRDERRQQRKQYGKFDALEKAIKRGFLTRESVYSSFFKDDLIAQKILETPLTLSAIVVPKEKVAQGILIQSTSLIWDAIVHKLKDDWSLAYQLTPDKWEEIVAGAFRKAGYDEVVLTPRSGDYGRDVIAVRKGVGCIKIIGSVKAYRLGHLVKHDDVRALLGVLSGEQDASKGIITTTSDFAPRITTDPFIKPFLPTRLELVNGEQLMKWLRELSSKS